MKIVKALEERSQRFVVTASLLLVLLLGVVSLLSGPDLSLDIFYVAPIFLAARFAGRRAGYLACAASALTWLAVAFATSEHYAHPAIPFWNVAARLGFVLILTAIISAFKTSHEHERELARTDYLTGAFNGRAFGEMASAEIERARRHAHPFTVAFMDVDDFKQVNDRFGHSAGDLLLRKMAETIRQNLRAVDVVARLGGDEFALLMPETDGAAARLAVRRLRQRLLEAARAGGWPVTFSVGVVTWEAPPANVDEMLRAADALMYSAKRGGKGAVRHQISAPSATAA